MQDQSQEPQSIVHGSCIGSVDILSEVALLGQQLMGINFKVPIGCKPSDENCKPALMDSCMCFRGEGLQTQKKIKTK